MRFPLQALAIVAIATLVEAAFAGRAGAQVCPTAASGKRGFVVERGQGFQGSKTEVFQLDHDITRTVWRSNGRVALETTQFQGLFQLDRVEEGRRTEFLPQTALADFFPLKPGQSLTASFNTKDINGQSRTMKIVLAVKDSGSISVGPCKYDVLKIDRSETWSSEAPRFVNTDYYSPELKLIIAKEYKRDGRTNLIKFDRISANP